ncbi:MAG: RluA family pseudouridine synthase [Candidatus Pacebacteria bacterium]|nr:RluA family pseudouridine synthase [Candidatus Paceibacterota bacterium]MCF7857614.1 RluA family pseudouridine synthase [Candidatus Paceibacterota bacterium]
MIKKTPEPEVIYEDNDMLVINKPAGMIVHNDGRNIEPTVVDWFLVRTPTAKDVGEGGFAQDGSPLERSGVVHRLDRETSGILVLAKTQEAFVYLKEQFHDHHIKKEYRTVVYGTMKEKWGTIARPIGRSTKDFRLRSAQRGARGALREALTDWELIGQTKTHAYLKIAPKTGRTHQIRVHLKAVGRPIVHDELYAPDELRHGENLGFSRLALHAYRLQIRLLNGEEQTFLAPLPADFETASTAIATQ